MSPAPLRFCLSSLEHDHAWWTANQILATPGVSLVGVAERRTDLHDGMRKRSPAIALYQDAAVMLDKEKPDALVVTAPNNEHRALVELCAARRIHCFVQKPLATTHTDALAIRRAAEGAGIKLLVNCHAIWDAPRVELLRRVRGGEVGPVQHMTAVNGHQGPRDMGVLTQQYKAWLYDPVRHGGGVVADQAQYGLVYIVWVLGRPAAVTATELPVKRHAEGWMDDMATVVLHYPAATAVVTVSWAWPHPRDELLCFGSKGSICLREGSLVRKNSPSRYDVPVDTQQIALPTELPPERTHGIAWFAHCLRDALPIDAPHDAATHVTICEITEAAIRSSRENRTVVLAGEET